ncbi:MAG TPA: hypothetical protein VM432_05325, partial [Bdellovibrionales bacterium]|nr:hypothetical protein [Bdellovibrionales bacterium]
MATQSMGSDGSEFFDGFLAQLSARYPRTAATFPIAERLSPTLVSRHKLQLPSSIREQAESIASAFFALRNESERNHRLSALSPETPDPGNASALMSYDFHIDTNGKLRLIEINTNASLSLIVSALYRFQNVKNVFAAEPEKDIVDSFQTEFDLFNG